MKIIVTCLCLLMFSLANGAQPAKGHVKTPPQIQQVFIQSKIGTETEPLYVKQFESPRSENDIKREDYEISKKPLLDWVTTWSTFVSAVLTLIVLGINIYLIRAANATATEQSKSTQQALKISKLAADAAVQSSLTMKETAEQQLRAYVMIPEIISTLNNSDSELKLDIKIKNYGQTPAINCQIVADFTLTDGVTNKDFKVVRKDGQGLIGSIPPNDQQLGHLTILRNQGLLEDKGKVLYIFGSIEYSDVFGKLRKTDFRFYNNNKDYIGEWLLDHLGNDIN